MIIKQMFISTFLKDASYRVTNATYVAIYTYDIKQGLMT